MKILNENLDSELKQFLKRHKQYIILNDLNSLYDSWSDYPTKLTNFLMSSGIDFLKYLTVIPSYCFYNTNILSIKIPNNITIIENNAFENCHIYGNLIIPNSVTEIWIHAFQGCKGIKHVTFGNSIKHIAFMAFAYCNGITGQLILPDSVENIEVEAFLECENIESIIIGKSIKWIGARAFKDCTKLKDIVIKATTPPKTGPDAFIYCDNELTIKVPTVSVEAYKSAINWENYNIIDGGF